MKRIAMLAVLVLIIVASLALTASSGSRPTLRARPGATGGSCES